MKFIELRNKIVNYQGKTFLYLNEGKGGSMGSDRMGRPQYRSYGEGDFCPEIAFVKKEGGLWVTHKVDASFIWSVEDFLNSVELVDENPRVLLIRVPIATFSRKPLGVPLTSGDWIEDLEIQLNPKPEYTHLHTAMYKPKVLAGNFPLDFKWIKKAIAAA